MRWIRDIALLLLLSAIGAGVLWYQMDRNEQLALLERATVETQRLEREIRFRAATKIGDLNARGWPTTVDPAWFEDGPPRNCLVDDGRGGERPWVEIASHEEAELYHPPIRLTLENHMAAFWYNPYLGVVRARVPVAVSDDAATSMYNAVNRVAISTIQWVEKPATKPNANSKPKDAAKKDGEKDESKAAATPDAAASSVIVVKQGPTPAKKP